MGGLPTFSLFPNVVGGAGELCGVSHLFLAVLGLRRCAGFLSSCGAWAAYCSGFSCRGAWVAGRVGLAVACELGGCDSQAREHRLNSCGPWC